MVWRAGMAQWVQARTVPEFFGAAGAQATPSPFPVSPWMPTGGETPNRDLMAQARSVLTGHWGLAIGFVVLFCVLMMASGFIPFGSLILAGPFQLGLVVFFLTLARRGNAEIGMLFAGFENFGYALGLYWMMVVLVWGWMLAFAVPGALIGVATGFATKPEYGIVVGVVLGGIPGVVAAFVAGLRYSMSYFILRDNPESGVLEPIRVSKRMMNGKKWKLFCLWCRFIGWGILSILTCYIGFLWLAPYVMVSMARFYDDLREASPNAAASPTPVNAPAAL
jgi:uncharacterized membrane protein